MENNEFEIELTEAELREMIKNGLTKLMENTSDSLSNEHGENLKPEELEEDSQEFRHTAGQRQKKAPLGKHSPHSQATIKERGDGETHFSYSAF